MTPRAGRGRRLVLGRDFDGWCWRDNGHDPDYPAGLDADTFGNERGMWSEGHDRFGRWVKVHLVEVTRRMR